MRIKLADGTERVFVTRSRLREVLDLDDEATFLRARELLIEAGLLTPHRRNRAPARGFLAPPAWEAHHVPHLHRRARMLLREDGFTNGGGRIRILAL